MRGKEEERRSEAGLCCSVFYRDQSINHPWLRRMETRQRSKSIQVQSAYSGSDFLVFSFTQFYFYLGMNTRQSLVFYRKGE